MKINLRYLPKKLTKRDKLRQIKMLKKSRRLYKKGTYYTRKNVSSFQSKKSPFITRAERMYNVDKIKELPYEYPYEAINYFLESITGKYYLIDKDYRIFIEKT